ncbi:MAG: T9SS C-terminal target domain-containing protein [Flavobacteriales bacterium]|nr:T9SS C-terminal target domain-containing protein [Flavobacteriales bacterium]MCB9194201.1 T9SS C-terminal target domain-containing protein [Flavobacteriales bacterium]
MALAVIGSVAAVLPACKKKEGCTDPSALNYDPDADKDCCCEYATNKEFTITDLGGGVMQVEGETDVNFTFSSSHQWLLKGFVYVNSGATLTVQPGTIVKGDKASKGSLIVRRGGKLMAAGTQSQPIVFTSNQPAGSRDYGDWGGIILCGRATQNQPSEPTVEGGPDATYGGSQDDDNSGVLQYVRIEFPGIAFQPNQEINGLTFAAVGSGTTIDHVQVSYSGDDSYEWFGGAVNCKYMIAFRGWDDEFDTDFGYHGKVQFGLGLRDPNIADVSGSNGFESDNDAAGDPYSPYTMPVFSNMSLYGPYTVSGTIDSQFKRGGHLRRATKLNCYNSVIAGWPTGLLIDGSAAQANADADELRVRNTVLAGCPSTLEVESGGTWDVSTWFNTASFSNRIIADLTDLMIDYPMSLSSPNLLPNAGSPLLSGADFSSGPVTDSYFTSTSYVGAFGDSDWTAGWTNFDPQNTVY